MQPAPTERTNPATALSGMGLLTGTALAPRLRHTHHTHTLTHTITSQQHEHEHELGLDGGQGRRPTAPRRNAVDRERGTTHGVIRVLSGWLILSASIFLCSKLSAVSLALFASICLMNKCITSTVGLN